MNDWKALLARARVEYAGNRRLRLGVLAIGVILGVYVGLVAWDWRASAHEQYVERRQYLRKLRALAGQDAWPARAEAAARLRKALDAEIPAVASVGLAQASAQSWSRELVSAFGADMQVQSRPAEEVEGQPGLYRVPVVISGPLSTRSVLNVVYQLEKRTSLAVVEEAMILNRENQTFQMTVVYYIRVREGGANAPD